MTYYEILEVAETASDDVILMAYKTVAEKYHPDVFNGDPQIAEEKNNRFMLLMLHFLMRKAGQDMINFFPIREHKAKTDMMRLLEKKRND